VFSNAGHNFPFVLFPSDESAVQSSKRSTPQSLMLSGNPLGVDESSAYQDKRRPIRAGERLVMFTDGLIECRSPGGEQWGRKALSGTLVSSMNAPDIEQMRDAIVGKAFGFFNGVPIADDVTLVVAEVDRSWVPGTQPAPAGQIPQDNPSLDLAV
jgi:sigma-B regulation protein RsbU (phosphoserine phosphatase)